VAKFFSTTAHPKGRNPYTVVIEFTHDLLLQIGLQIGRSGQQPQRKLRKPKTLIDPSDVKAYRPVEVTIRITFYRISGYEQPVAPSNSLYGFPICREAPSNKQRRIVKYERIALSGVEWPPM
jgi:hypothetical protein